MNVFLVCISSIVYFLSEITQASDPETFLNNAEMIRYWGYPVEEYTSITGDGYILGMQRIPHGKNVPETGQNVSCRPVVFMFHGLDGDASSWTINLPNQSAAYIFADAGFDVWLANARGNTYSKNHVSLNTSDQRFWEFSWDEIAQYDIPAMVETALNITEQSSLYYIGHSQGTLTMFAKLSTDPIFSQKIKKYFALAPVGSVGHIDTIGSEFARVFADKLQLCHQLFGSIEITPNCLPFQLFDLYVCGTSGRLLCHGILDALMGPMTDQFNASRSEVYFYHNPAGTSTQNFLHWSQMIKYGTVYRFDYGNSATNKANYGTTIPPPYNFSTITTDMYLYWSNEDHLSDPADINGYLIPSLNPDYVKEKNILRDFSHMDFIWGFRAADEIYHPIINLIKKELGGTVGC